MQDQVFTPSQDLHQNPPYNAPLGNTPVRVVLEGVHEGCYPSVAYSN